MWSVVQKVEAIPYMAWVGFTSPQLSKFPFFHGWLKKNHYVDELHLNHYYLYLLNILLVPLVHNKGASDPQLGNAACDHTWPRPMAGPRKRQKLNIMAEFHPPTFLENYSKPKDEWRKDYNSPYLTAVKF